MNCNCGKSECPQALKSFRTGWVPRGFSPHNSSRTKILVVGKNPGHPLEGETSFYKNKKGEVLLSAREKWSIEWLKRLKNTNDNSLKYHKNLRRYLRYFLDLSAKLEQYDEYKPGTGENAIKKAVSFSNLFKCSTECEQEKIKDNSFGVCYEKYFIREIELIKPQIILALGNEVSKYLKRKQLSIPLVSIKHPSYFYKGADEVDILSSKKRELRTKLIRRG